MTFLDALRLVRQAPHATAEDLQALLALYDDRGITDGAREVLGDFLKGRARDLAHERLASEKVLTMSDSGKTVRVRKGHRIELKLPTRPHRGGVWELKTPAEDVSWVPSGFDTDRRHTLGALVLDEPGRFSIELAEALAPPKKSHAKSQKPADEDRLFKLEVIVEAEAPKKKR